MKSKVSEPVAGGQFPHPYHYCCADVFHAANARWRCRWQGWAHGLWQEQGVVVRRPDQTTFADVAGVEEAKEDVQELVDFLRDPSKFQTLGGQDSTWCVDGGFSGHR